MSKFVPLNTQSLGQGTFVPLRGQGGKPKKKSRSVGGFLGNLGTDVKDAAVGLPTGVVTVVGAAAHDATSLINPGRITARGAHDREKSQLATIGKAVGTQYKQTYGPLLRGDVKTFSQEFYAHPVAPILDVAAVLTGGGALAAKAGGALAKAGVVSDASRVARLGEARSLELRSPRAVTQGEGPVLKAKALSRNPVTRSRQVVVDKALKRLPAATPVIGEYARFGRELERLPRLDSLRLTHKADSYNRAADKLSTEEAAALQLISRGVHPSDYLELLEKQDGVSPTMRKVLANPKVSRLVDSPSDNLVAAHAAASELAKTMTNLKVERGVITRESAKERLGLHRRVLAEEGIQPRTLSLKPLYMPDVPFAGSVPSGRKAGGGIGIPKKLGSAKRNEGVLFKSGRLDIAGDALAPEYGRTIKFGLHSDLHAALAESAPRVPIGEPLPKGHVFLRKSAGEKIHAIERTSGDREAALRQLVPDAGKQENELPSFGTTDPADAVELDGHRLVIPARLAKQVAGEFTNPAEITKLLSKPTQVWRALVLGYRPAFLVNNLVGNHLLYALRNAGPSGLRAYLNAVRTAKGPQAVEKLLRDPQTRDVITPDFIREHFPEHAETFGSTQSVKIRNPRTRRIARRAGSGIIPATQAIAEGMLRRANVEAVLRRSPEVRAVADAITDQTTRFEKIAKTALEKNPELQRRVSQEVNDTLGSYIGLTPFERNVVRSVFPFYGWLRAISMVSAKMVLDTPGRALLLTRLGQLGHQITEDELGPVPDYLEGAIPLGHDSGSTERVLTTGGLNPFATLPQIGGAATALVAGEPGEAGKAIDNAGVNPFLSGLIEQLTGKSLYSGGPVKRGHVPGVLGGILEGVGTELPFTRVGTAGPTKLYPNRSRLTELLAASGVPVKDVSKSEARSRAARQASGR